MGVDLSLKTTSGEIAGHHLASQIHCVFVFKGNEYNLALLSIMKQTLGWETSLGQFGPRPGLKPGLAWPGLAGPGRVAMLYVAVDASHGGGGLCASHGGGGMY